MDLKETIPGTPSKNDLLNMQKKHKKWNEKHPHALSFFNKDAGNVELNNKFFNNSVRYKDLDSIEAKDLDVDYFAGDDVADVSVSSDITGVAPDGGSAVAEELTIDEAWDELNKCDDIELNEAGGLKSFFKNLKNLVSSDDADETKKEPETFNGYVIYNNDGAEVSRKEYPRVVAASDNSKTVINDIKNFIKGLGYGFGKAYVDGTVVYNSKINDSINKLNLKVWKFTDEKKTKEYDAITFNSAGELKTLGKEDSPNSLKLGNISTSNITIEAIGMQILKKGLSDSEKASKEDKSVHITYQMFVDSKLVLDTKDLSSTEVGKSIFNKLNVEEKSQLRQQELKGQALGKAVENNLYYWAIVLLGKSDILKETGIYKEANLVIDNDLDINSLPNKDLINGYLKSDVCSFEIYFKDGTLVYQKYSDRVKGNPRIDSATLKFIGKHVPVDYNNGSPRLMGTPASADSATTDSPEPIKPGDHKSNNENKIKKLLSDPNNKKDLQSVVNFLKGAKIDIEKTEVSTATIRVAMHALNIKIK